ncbi:MAG: hypothetical protein WAV45_07260 [Propionibacteriaceae bacterium]
MLLHRFTVKPGHLDAYLALWPDEVALRRRHGFDFRRAFVETDAEPKMTWLYAHPDESAGLASLAADPDHHALQDATAPHVFRNATIRPVDVEILTESADLGRLAIMRRYAITGSWDDFLAIWRRIVPVRERHGNECLFAVADRPTNMFTWAFGFGGDWSDFPESQRAYYRDPERVALRGVFDYMADYAIHPARQLALPTSTD